MKTKEDILDELTEGRKGLFNNDVQVSFDDALKAMQEYADQQTEQLKKQLEEKEKEVEDLKTKVTKRDIQKIFCEGLEDNHHRNVYYENKKLKSQISEKDKEHKEHVEKLCRNIRILEERVKDGDKELSEQIEATNRNAEKGLLAVMELSELKAKHKECFDALIGLYNSCNPEDVTENKTFKGVFLGKYYVGSVGVPSRESIHKAFKVIINGQ